MHIGKYNRLPSWHIADRWIVVRADLNVPLSEHGEILSDFKLQSFQPTLAYLLDAGARVVLITHLGSKDKYGSYTSTSTLRIWFETHQYNPIYAHSLEQAQTLQKTSARFIILENIRRWPEEETQDKAFAIQLYALGEYYVNDAFGSLHNTETSLTTLAYLYEPSHRSIGFLVEKELRALDTIITQHQKPFVAIMGGNKFRKLSLLPGLFKLIDHLLLCPLLSEPFITDTYNAMVDSSMIAEIIGSAEKYKATITLPLDYQVIYNKKIKNILARTITSEKILSFGNTTTQLYTDIISESKTVFFNGLSGFTHIPESLSGITALFKAMSTPDIFSVVAGGDSCSAAIQLGFERRFSLLSTGGGATLAYLSGAELPALKPFFST